jgi:hypothetical protein
MSKNTTSASATGLPASGLDAELIKLGIDLEDVHRRQNEIENSSDNAEQERLCAEHWTLREKIDAIPAHNEGRPPNKSARCRNGVAF